MVPPSLVFSTRLPLFRQFGRQNPSKILDRHVPHGGRESHGLVAARITLARGFSLGLALAGDGIALRFRNDEDHLLQEIFRRYRLVAAFPQAGDEVLVRHLATRTITGVHKARPAHLHGDEGFEVVGADTGLGEDLRQLLRVHLVVCSKARKSRIDFLGADGHFHPADFFAL